MQLLDRPICRRHLVWAFVLVGAGIASWRYVPAGLSPVLLIGLVVAFGSRRRGAGAPDRHPVDSASVLARRGIADIESHLARHAAFDEYLQRRERELSAGGEGSGTRVGT